LNEENSDDEPGLSEINFARTEISERLDNNFRQHDFELQSICPNQTSNLIAGLTSTI
jgi:hypothetical protein